MKVHQIILFCYYCRTVYAFSGNRLNTTELHQLEEKNSTSFLKCSAGSNQCTAWKYCDLNRQCKCGRSPFDMIKCLPDGNLVLETCTCATYDNITNTTQLGKCLYNCERHGNNYFSSAYKIYSQDPNELNEALCDKFNRRGSLCGSCKDGYYPLAYSYNMTCVRCEDTWYNWVEYLVVVYLPLTVFFFIILFFQVNMTSSYWIGFVIFSQAISFPMMSRIAELSYHTGRHFKTITEITLSLYGIWNLEFFRVLNNSTCLRLNFLVLTALDYLSGLYPLILLILTYAGVQLYTANIKAMVVISKPIRILFMKFRSNFRVKSSLIDAFLTFFLLSSMKLFNVSGDLLIPVPIYSLNSDGSITTSNRLYLNTDTV